jgi:hypothetical protein
MVYSDNQTGQHVFRVKITGPDLPPKVSNIVKDAAGNLRDALDHAVYSAAVVLVGGKPTDTGFPFAKDLAGVRGELNGKRLAGNPPEIRALLESFCPYEGGNATLWAMNQIRNPNTHRFIVPVGSAITGTSIGISFALPSGNCTIGYSKWDAARNEVEYMRLGPGSHMNHQVNVTMSVAFEGIDAVNGKPVVPTLNLMADEADRIVAAIEAETLKVIALRRPAA